MSSLSSKLAGIVLNTFNYGKHLGNKNGQITVIDEKLAHKNFKHSGEHLYELWNHDPINRQPVITTYIKEHDHSVFSEVEKKAWNWIDCHSQIYKYSLEIHKCENRNCCSPPRVPNMQP